MKSHRFLVLSAALVVFFSGLSPLTAQQRSLRLVSAPDLINADVAYRAGRCFDLDETAPDFAAKRQIILDARTRAGFAAIPSHSGDTNNDGVLSVQEGFRGGMEDMIETIAAENPDAFLVSGDLVDGSWATSQFKPISANSPLAVRQAHVRDQAAIYYGAYHQHFIDAGYTGPIYSVIGDHEIGDNNWGPSKIELFRDFIQVYRDYMGMPETVAGDGAYVDAPLGAEGRYWAQKIENVLLMGIETFDVKTDLPNDDPAGNVTAIDPDGGGTKRALMPQAQLDWIDATLALASADTDIDHIIVMGHSPFDTGNVRKAGSSGLLLAGGTTSDLWQIFETHGVDLYLAGEVHAVSGYKKNGVFQLVTSGNQFNESTKSNYLVIDVYEDRLLLTLKEALSIYNGDRSDRSDAVNEDKSKSMEWRTRHGYAVVATATLYNDGTMHYLEDATGKFVSFVSDQDGAAPGPIPPFTPDPEPVPAVLPSDLTRPGGLSVVASGDWAEKDTHPGVVLTLEPARNSILLLAVSGRFPKGLVMDPVLVDGQFHELVEVAFQKNNGATVAIFAADLGNVIERQNSIVSGRFWRDDGSEADPTNHAATAVQLEGASLAGLQQQVVDSPGNASPLTRTFTGKDEGTLLLVAGGINQGASNVQLGTNLVEVASYSGGSRDGNFMTGWKVFDSSETASFSWGAILDQFKDAGMAAVSVNPVPEVEVAVDPGLSELTLSWHSATGPSVLLESSTDLQGSWGPVAGTPVLNGDSYEMTVPLGGVGSVFYRLDLP